MAAALVGATAPRAAQEADDPQLSQPQGAEARINALREWAMSLSAGAPREEVPDATKLVLPPLRSLKDYRPECPLPVAPSPPTSVRWECLEGPPERERERERLPKHTAVSTLGSPAAPWPDGPLALSGPSELSAAVAEAKTKLFMERSPRPPAPLAREVEITKALTGARPRRARPPPRTSEVLFSESGAPVRGKDPLAGGLFGRGAVLDPVAMRKGVYEAQLAKR